MSPVDDWRADAIAHTLDVLAVRGVVVELPEIHVKPVRCGRYHHKTHSITLPCWLFAGDRMASFVDYYICHELAHAALRRPGHDLEFQLMLAHLCPINWHWESTYKPRRYSEAVALVGMR